MSIVHRTIRSTLLSANPERIWQVSRQHSNRSAARAVSTRHATARIPFLADTFLRFIRRDCSGIARCPHMEEWRPGTSFRTLSESHDSPAGSRQDHCSVVGQQIHIASFAIPARRVNSLGLARPVQASQEEYLRPEHRCSSQLQSLKPSKPRVAVHMALHHFRTVAFHGQELPETSIRCIRQ